MFKAGELMRLAGAALREGHAKPHQITLYIMERRGGDHQDTDLLGALRPVCWLV